MPSSKEKDKESGMPLYKVLWKKNYSLYKTNLTYKESIKYKDGNNFLVPQKGKNIKYSVYKPYNKPLPIVINKVKGKRGK